MRLEEDYGGGKLSPLGELLEEGFQMRRVIAPFSICRVHEHPAVGTRGQAQLAHPSELKWEAIMDIPWHTGTRAKVRHHSSARVDG